MRGFKAILVLGMLAAAANTATASIWDAYVIREGSSGAPGINDITYEGIDAKEFIITESGMKAGWGTSALDGVKVGDIGRLAIARLDDVTRFTAGSGPAVAPYLNLWITDGQGNYAVIGNEPSNPAFQSLYDGGYNLTWDDLSDKVAKAYENTDKSWLPNDGVNMTFADIANFTIQAPTPSEQTWSGLGTGAPRVLTTNEAYGVNWIFGDTLANYVSGDEGYIVANPVATAIPEPASVAIWSVIGLGFVAFGCSGRRRRRAGAA